MRAIVLVAVAAFIVAAAPAPVAHAASFTITATDTQWTPNVLDIDVGDSVTFVTGNGVHSWIPDHNNMTACNLPCVKTFNAAGAYHFHCGYHGYAMVGVIQVGLAATLPTVAISSPAADTDVLGTVLATGTASSPTNDPVTVYAYLDGGQLLRANLSGGTWTASIPSASLTDGPHTLYAIAADRVGQRTTSLHVNVTNPPTYDVYVTSLTPRNPDRTAGPVLTYTLRNDGNSPTPPYHIQAQYSYKNVWRTFAEIQGPTVAAHGRAEGDISWSDGLHVGKYPVRVIGDSQNEIAELTEANNVEDSLASWFTDKVAGIDPQDP